MAGRTERSHYGPCPYTRAPDGMDPCVATRKKTAETALCILNPHLVQAVTSSSFSSAERGRKLPHRHERPMPSPSGVKEDSLDILNILLSRSKPYAAPSSPSTIRGIHPPHYARPRRAPPPPPKKDACAERPLSMSGPMRRNHTPMVPPTDDGAAAGGGGRAEAAVILPVDWREHRESMSRLFPEIRRELRFACMYPPHPTRDSHHTFLSEILVSPDDKAKLLLGKDLLFYGLSSRSPEYAEIKTDHERFIVDCWNDEIVSDRSNPHNISCVLSFGTRLCPKEIFRPALRDVKHETYYIEDHFTSVEQARENVRSLLSLTSGAPIEAFDLEVEAHPPVFPFVSGIFEIKKGSITTDIPIENWFQKPFLSMYETLEKREAVFVHCQQGVSRSATITILWLMYTFKVEYEHAHALVLSQRSFINPNPLWISLMREVESRLLES